MNLSDLDPQRAGRLQSLIWSFREARTLQVAVRLKLFTALEGEPKRVDQLAAALDTDIEMTERLLVVLAGLDLVIQDENLWRNCLVASVHLVEGKPLYQGEVVEFAAELWDLYTNLEGLVRHGRQGERYEMLHRRYLERQATYLRALHGMAITGQAQRLARVLGALGGRRTLLDVGGAPGTYSVALCQRFPTLQATILDHPEALGVTKSVIEQFDLGDRVTLKEGDWKQKRFGKNEYDSLLLSYLLSGSEAQALEQLIKAYDALKRGGLLIVQATLLENDMNGPTWAAHTNLVDNAFTLDQMRSLITEAGFERCTLLCRDVQGGDVFLAYKPIDSPEESQSLLMEYISPEQEIFALMGLGEEENALTVQRTIWERLVRSN